MGISRTGKVSNPKSESPDPKQPRSPKFQKKTRKRTMNCFDYWTSRIRICLGFGISRPRGESACEPFSPIYHSPVTIHGKPTASPTEARVVELADTYV